MKTASREIDTGDTAREVSTPAVLLDEVTRRYRPGRRVITALDGISLKIDRGEFVAVVGASGSGKSTLLNVISGIDSCDSGTIQVLDTNLSQMGEDRLAAWRGRNIGIVFQFFQLMPTLTVRENVVLPMDLAGLTDDKWRRADRLLDSVGISDLGDNLPSELSGGEQQRAAIARALANDPSLLIADEPTGNLDTKNGRIVIEIIERLWRRGTTVLMVTHDIELSKRAPRRITMRDGRITDDLLNGTLQSPGRTFAESHADAD